MELIKQKRSGTMATRRATAIANGEPTTRQALIAQYQAMQAQTAAMMNARTAGAGPGIAQQIMNNSAMQNTQMMLNATNNISMMNAASAMSMSATMSANASHAAFAHQSKSIRRTSYFIN